MLWQPSTIQNLPKFIPVHIAECLSVDDEYEVGLEIILFSIFNYLSQYKHVVVIHLPFPNHVCFSSRP